MEAIEKNQKVPQLDARANELRNFLKVAIEDDTIDPTFEWVIKARAMTSAPSRASMKLK